MRGTHHLLAAIARRTPSARVVVTGSALVYKPDDRPIAEESELKPASPYAVSFFTLPKHWKFFRAASRTSS